MGYPSKGILKFLEEILEILKKFWKLWDFQGHILNTNL